MIDLTTLTRREKLILGGAAAVAVLGVFPWFEVSFGGVAPEMAAFLQNAADGTSVNALRSTEGLLAWLGALATIALVVADHGGFLPWTTRARRLAPLVAIGASAVFMLAFCSRGHSFSAEGISAGRTLWFYGALAAAAATGWHAYQRWQEAASLRGTPNIEVAA